MKKKKTMLAFYRWMSKNTTNYFNGSERGE